MDFPKYQISRMDGEYQVVYRTDKEEEFVQFLAEIKKLEIKPIGSTKKVEVKIPSKYGIENVNVTADDFEDEHMCPEHNVKMKEKESKTKTDEAGNPKKYWSHSRKIGDKWETCFGRGFKSF